MMRFPSSGITPSRQPSSTNSVRMLRDGVGMKSPLTRSRRSDFPWITSVTSGAPNQVNSGLAVGSILNQWTYSYKDVPRKLSDATP